MATLTISKKEIEKEIKLTEENIERIMLLGIPIEISGDEVTIEVLSNRPDLFSLEGFLRAVKNFISKKPELKKYHLKKPEKNYKVIVDKSVKKVRPFTACAIVKKIKLDDGKIKSLIDMQEKLHATMGRNRKKAAIGIYPLDKIALPIRFEARAPKDIKFVPLDSNEEMNALQILQRNQTGKEYAHLLEGYESFPIFVDSNNKILSMPPIINSNETGKVTTSTNSMFVECSGFDLNNLKKILNIIVTTFIDMGAEVYQMEIVSDKKEITPDLSHEIMKIDLNKINSLLGLDLKEKDLEKLLPKMGYEYQSGKVKIPAYRNDILHEVDIAEDIAIAYGYEKLVPEMPKVATIAQESKESKIQSKIANILTGLGLLETSSYHLIKKEEIDKSSKHLLEVKNSKTEYKVLRPNLLIPTLRILKENTDNEYPQKIFELGRVFRREEKDHLLIASIPSNFTAIKQILDYLMKMISIKYDLKEESHESFIDGRTATILVNNKSIGVIGEIHPSTLKDSNLKMPLSVIEISLEEIYKLL